jgi:SagB-type dehydrogenase family enzyme
MTSNGIVWTYALAPDVDVHRAGQEVLLRTAAGQTRIEGIAEIATLDLLAGSGSTEEHIQIRMRSREPHCDADARCAALLYRLERRGLLTRTLSSAGRPLASCVPVRPPPDDLPQHLPQDPLRLSPHAVARAEAGHMVLDAPGAWAKMLIHDRDLLALLSDLAAGTPAADITATLPAEATQAVLALMDSCGLLDRGTAPGWAGHDLLFHARTRAGYARGLRSKIADDVAPPQPDDAFQGAPRIPLAQPDRDLLLTKDPPYVLVAERRRSIRRQGSTPLTAAQLSEFLFRTLHERDGRRPYPSGGSCYPLRAYVAVHRCLGVASGLFAYDPIRHELITVREPGTALDRLLADAAGAAAVDAVPQILVVLAAQYARIQTTYPDIGYSLILKEVGAVFQTAMMAAAAMGLAACPLGLGNSLHFSQLAGIDPLIASSVGELMLGSLDHTV